MKYDQKVEVLAELIHNVFREIVGKIGEDGQVSKELFARWRARLIPYKDLSREAKAPRRKWARLALRILREESENPKTRLRVLEAIRDVQFPIERKLLVKEIQNKLDVKKTSAYFKLKYLVREGRLTQRGNLIDRFKFSSGK